MSSPPHRQKQLIKHMLLIISLFLVLYIAYNRIPPSSKAPVQKMNSSSSTKIKATTDIVGVFMETSLVAVDNARLKLLYHMAKKKYKLKVKVDNPEVVEHVEVYSGYANKLSGDPRYGDHNFEDARLVAKKQADPFGNTEFLLKPGRYSVYLLPDYNHPSQKIHGGISFFVEHVYLNQDKQVTPNPVINY